MALQPPLGPSDEEETPYSLLGLPQPATASEESSHRRFPLRLVAAVVIVALAAALFWSGWLGHSLWQSQPSRLTQDSLGAKLMPEEGQQLDIRWGGVFARLVQEGVLDVGKFQAAAQRAGHPLTPEQLRILTEGSSEKIRVDEHNTYFLLNVLWALGLANKNPILENGAIMQGGQDAAASYASTGGWTLGKEIGPTYLNKYEVIKLTPQQQEVVEEVAYNSYRPCCGNMTAFPDCNHGMAALALAELMAAQGATADEIFDALKKISPYWFPTQYRYVAAYLQMQDNDWDKAEGRLIMGEDYSSLGGLRKVVAELQASGRLPDVGPRAASGCAP